MQLSPNNQLIVLRKLNGTIVLYEIFGYSFMFISCISNIYTAPICFINTAVYYSLKRSHPLYYIPRYRAILLGFVIIHRAAFSNIHIIILAWINLQSQFV